jgi:phosphoribosylformimino-5-aminoimidazole carboxamide ribotide isomerase
MMVTPAVDLRSGKCVQLVGGSYANQLIELDDPVAAAVRWSELGFTTLHVVDLDAATGRGSNIELVHEILQSTPAATQVGGGLRTKSLVERTLLSGAHRVVVGTRAIEDKDWLEDIAWAFPMQIIIALDVREREIVARGWQKRTGRSVDVELSDLDALPLAGVLVTAVHREGLMGGSDLPLMKEIVALTELPVQASGGVATTADLEALQDAGVSAAVVGMALYSGQLNPAHIDKDMK